ncbi:GDSL esterase/lipase 1-like [Punica granatum]|uniref:Uncharacterized protein n=2 Tax=Punica granatum TaxID=22663 RepID=A0A218WUR9_PUNGR|nr:GDSL esterase/lipase 1-like [Punica granatum]OWM76403.1 hypothetical protein CDL15_Pgr028273 [Punica granatum]PKI41275.1 hypothetical protein CRG98_038337 [Punica granatum]
MSIPTHFLTILVAVLAGRASCSASLWQPENQAALFIFGDSLFDCGNNNFINTTSRFRANVYPYGESFFKHPTGRFSDGLIMPDFIAKYAGLPLIPPYLKPGKYQFMGGANFASAGAGALAETFPGFVVDLMLQLRQFEHMEEQLKENFGHEMAEKILSKAVYLISIGSNDYAFPFVANSALFQSHSHEQYMAMVIGNLTSVIKGIHSKGGRKFGFLNLGPIGCLPDMRSLAGTTGSCLKELNELSKLHNGALSRALLRSELDEFKYSNFNFFDVLREKINNPSKYGFKEGKEACCGSGPYRGRSSCGGRNGETEYELCANPSEYVFFDAGHPSEKVNKQVAELMWSGSTEVIGPYNLEALFKLK